MWDSNTNKPGSTTSKEWTTPASWNMPSPTNPEEEGITDAPRNGGNRSMPEQVKQPNPWGNLMMMIYIYVYIENMLRTWKTMTNPGYQWLVLLSVHTILLVTKQFFWNLYMISKQHYIILHKLPKITILTFLLTRSLQHSEEGSLSEEKL